MLRELAGVPLFPQRVLDHLAELVDTTRGLLDSQTEQRKTLRAVDDKIAVVRANSDQIPEVKAVMETIRVDVNRLEEWVVRMQHDVRHLAQQIDEIVPGDREPGPLAKAKDALTGK
jgi:predicted nuclease with TOPRIM domain